MSMPMDLAITCATRASSAAVPQPRGGYQRGAARRRRQEKITPRESPTGFRTLDVPSSVPLRRMNFRKALLSTLQLIERSPEDLEGASTIAKFVEAKQTDAKTAKIITFIALQRDTRGDLNA